MENTKQSVFEAILRESFHAFMHKAFLCLNPSQAFQDNWHLEAITYQLERCHSGECNRLLITLPPRSLKSHIASVSFPAYVLGKDPTSRIICASYSQGLADHLSAQTRATMDADWYKNIFPATRVGSRKDSVSEFITDNHGGRLATSVGGTLTGRGAQFIIVDDPHKAEEVESGTLRSNVHKWFTGSLLSRLDHKETGVIVVILQRLHEDDLASHLIKAGGWEHLNLAAISEEEKTIALSNTREKKLKTGELLHPERDNSGTLERIKSEIGSYAFSAQYQQSPVPSKGNIIPVNAFARYDDIPAKAPSDLIVQSWDLANSVGDNTDYSVGTTWLCQFNKYFLLNVYRERKSYAELRTDIVSQATYFDADLVIIEKTGVGFAMIDELKHFSHRNILEFVPRLDKVTRMMPGTADVEGGRVIIPKAADWLAGFLNECSSFPKGKNDDQIDSMSQFLEWARGRQRDNEDIDNLIEWAHKLSGAGMQKKSPQSNSDFYKSLRGPNSSDLGHLVDCTPPGKPTTE